MRPTRICRMPIGLVLIVGVFLNSPAQDIDWTNAAGGNFDSGPLSTGGSMVIHIGTWRLTISSPGSEYWSNAPAWLTISESATVVVSAEPHRKRVDRLASDDAN